MEPGLAKIAPHLRLPEKDIDAILSRETRCRIATIGPAEAINLTPMTFGWAGGKIFIFARGQKIANLRRNSTATILVDLGDNWYSLQGIMLQGCAKVLEDITAEQAEPDLSAARMNLGVKHNLSKDNQPAPYTASASGRSRRWIVFTPNNIVSWDNQRLERHSE